MNYMVELEPELIEPRRVDCAIGFTTTTESQANFLFKDVFCNHLGEKLESLAE
jgi:hypothetical protein